VVSRTCISPFIPQTSAKDGYLVGALEHGFYFSIQLGIDGNSNPTDELIVSRGVAKKHQPGDYNPRTRNPVQPTRIQSMAISVTD
jgi:hypothetical protein